MIIRRFLAGFFLLLFAFSITPKKALHDFFANHKDVPVRASAAKVLQFTQSGYNCNCEDLVVESPFIESSSLPMVIAPSPCWSTACPGMKKDFYPMPPRYFELRGPPVVA